ncbi:MAG: tetratricopeptide repeat protein [Terriglobales bacterium]
MNFSLRTLAIVLTSCTVALCQSKPGSGTGSTGSGSGSTTTTPSVTTPTTPSRTIPPVQQQMQMPIFLSGRVVMDDGTSPSERVSIERVCSGQAVKEAYTDSRGFFSFTIGGGTVNMEMQDASTSSDSRMGSPGMMSGMGSMGGVPGQTQNLRQSLFGCELRASLPGTLSEMVELAPHLNDSLTNPDVGTIVLHRIGKVDGSSVSVTSMQAPKDARKAFEHGRKELKKNEFDKAKDDLMRAVTAYPSYAEAWAALSEVQLHEKDYPNAIASSQKAIAADSHFIAPYFTLISASADQQDWKNTAQYADKLISLDAYHYPAAYYYDALAYLQMNDLQKAVTSIVAARKYDMGGSLPKAALLMGEILMRKQDYAGAVGAYKAYLERVPTGPSSDFARNELNAAQTKLAANGPAPAPAATPK